MHQFSTSRALWLGAALIGVVSVTGAMSLGLGPASLDDPEIGGAVLRLRGYRWLGALLSGGALAVGGVLVQGLFRNPLASPSILGTTAGASLGGQLALLAQATLLADLPLAAESWLPLGCIGGALLSLVVLLAFLRRGVDRVAVLLIGFILSALFVAVGSFVVSIAQERHELGRAVIAFTLGGLGGVGLVHIAVALPLIAAGLIAAWGWSPSLDLMLSGETEASSLGLDVARVRRWTVAWVAVMTSAAVAIGGNVSFVGLVVPHALRGQVGATHRRLVGLAFVGGAAFVGLCDLAVRLIPSRTEIPLGIVTGLVGAPVFLILLARERQR